MNRAKSKASNENVVERHRGKVRDREGASEAKGALGINWKEPCRFVVVDMFDGVRVCVRVSVVERVDR